MMVDDALSDLRNEVAKVHEALDRRFEEAERVLKSAGVSANNAGLEWPALGTGKD